MCKKKVDIKKGAPTIEEFMQQFKTNKDAIIYLLEYVYPEGKIVCPHCGCTERIFHNKGVITTYGCAHCRKGFSPLTGTMFENTRLSYKSWMQIIYSMFVARRSISGLQLNRQIDISNRGIYHIRRLIQMAMANYDLKPFSGNIDIDEGYLGGSNHGRYPKEKEKDEKIKYPVFGILEEETGRVYSHIAIPNKKGQYLTGTQLKDFVEKTCKPGSTIISDDWKSYRVFDKPDSGYFHEIVDHSCEYQNDNGYSTSRIEGYWSELKRMYYGTHSWFTKKYAHLYLAECDFRHNHQEWKEALDTILKQSVFFPRVIDIRQMGKFGNRTYSLKDYRMILPASFDEIPLEHITVKDILNCDEPVYGILRVPYLSRKQRQMGMYQYKDEWADLGYQSSDKCSYKDYRTNIVNSEQDVFDMIKDASKYKEVNSYTKIIAKKPIDKEHRNTLDRNRHLKVRYARMPKVIQKQIREEYPNLWSISDANKTREIHNRLTSLIAAYKRHIALTGEKNEFHPVEYDKEVTYAKNRRLRLKKRYNELPEELQKQILLEYPNMFEVSAVEETRPIRNRMTSLLYEYNKLNNLQMTRDELYLQNLGIRRNNRLKKRYANLPKQVQELIITEYPNLFEVTDKSLTKEITHRIVLMENAYKRKVLNDNDAWEKDLKFQENMTRALKERYRKLPDPVRLQVALEYPNILEVSSPKEIIPIRNRMNALVKSYKKVLGRAL